MGLEQLTAGNNAPDDINVVIEIPSRSNPIKYEYDKNSNMIAVDRFLSTSMMYPCEYGFIPHTLSEDGDPVDVLVVAPYSLFPGCLLRCRPIGMLRMVDESGPDVKILAVPITKLSKMYQDIKKPEDLGMELINAIEHFFKHYKDLEPGKWAKTSGWESLDATKEEILASIQRYQQKASAT